MTGVEDGATLRVRDDARTIGVERVQRLRDSEAKSFGAYSPALAASVSMTATF